MSDKKAGGSKNIPVEFIGEQEPEQARASPDQPEAGAGRPADQEGSEVEQVFDLRDDLDLEAGGDLRAPAGEPAPVTDQLQAALADAQQRVQVLTEEKKSLQDQLLRRQAEFDNFRKRSERERGESSARTRAEILKQFLPIVDNFERALKHSAPGVDEGNDGGLRTGVELIYKQLMDLLTRSGLEPVQAVGQPFDPHLHEAVTMTPSDEYPENTVLEELQRGYLLNGKLLRPATVRVSSKK